MSRDSRITAHVLARVAHSRSQYQAREQQYLTSIFDKERETMSTPTSSNGLNTSGSQPVRVQIGREQTVSDLGTKPVAPNTDSSPMGEQYQPSPIKVVQTDHNALQGSNLGNHLSGNLDHVPAPPTPGVREGMTQFKSSRYETTPPFQSSTDETVGD